MPDKNVLDDFIRDYKFDGRNGFSSVSAADLLQLKSAFDVTNNKRLQ